MIEKPFAFSYQFEGKSWGFDLPAKDHAEAERRVRAIGLTGKVDGELHCSVPVLPEPRRLFVGNGASQYLIPFLIGAVLTAAMMA
jgi:hypothetical protein